MLLTVPLCAQQGHARIRRNDKQNESASFQSAASALTLDKGARANLGGQPTLEHTNPPEAGPPEPHLRGAEVARPGLGGADKAAGQVSEDRQDIIRRIEFTGLRRIAPAALREHITSREGQPLDAARIADDVRALDRLGWFDSVTVEVHPIPVFLADRQTGVSSEPEWRGPNDPAELVIESARLGAAAQPVGDISRPLALTSTECARTGLLLLFVLEERPFLARVEFRGSRVLSRERIAEVLEQKRIALKLAAPANRTELWRAARAIEAALADLGHPQARVRLRLEETPTAAAVATYEIQDGPRIGVARVVFAGNHAFSERTLRRQMKRVAPGPAIAGIPISLGLGKKIYTPERLAEDVERVTNFYRNHGFPEAQVGNPSAEVTADRVRNWFPWPRRRTAPRFHIAIPVEEGRFYRLGAVEVEKEAAGGERVERRGIKDGHEAPGLQALRGLRPGEPYSQQEVERAAENLSRSRGSQLAGPWRAVDVRSQLDPDAGLVRVTFRVHEAQSYIVRRLEFSGQRRFSDRYYRRRILLKEGEPFDVAKLEQGLAQLARTGFIRPVKQQDIRMSFDEERRTVNMAIHLEEIGRQRFSVTGGLTGFGNTAGVVYNVFDLLGGEELITAHIEGGPQSVQTLLGVAKEGLLGTRASLGLSLFNNLVRPNLPGAPGHQRLFTSRSSGVGLSSTYPLTARDTFGVNYQLSHTSTEYGLNLPPAISCVVGNSLRASTASRSIGLNESHYTGRERWDAAASVSGGWLGGDENLLRASAEYARLWPDRLAPYLHRGGAQLDEEDRRNAWAFRGHLAGVSSFRGELPLQARLFAGDELVRGFRSGELVPYALVKSGQASGTPTYRAQAVGADLVGAVNTEYRLPLTQRTEAAAFFDAGSGWLLPGWLGANRPALLGGTSGVLRASAGVEMRWQVPIVGQTVRVHYAVNPMRLARAILLPDGSAFRPPDRGAALGWAIGTLF